MEAGRRPLRMSLIHLALMRIPVGLFIPDGRSDRRNKPQNTHVRRTGLATIELLAPDRWKQSAVSHSVPTVGSDGLAPASFHQVSWHDGSASPAVLIKG